MARHRAANRSSLYWHDYETTGVNPRRDRPVQFGGVRTDEALNVIGDPLVIYCRPSDDVLPQPDACLITGISPRLARERGLSEAGFMARIHEELAQTGTCGVGYNSIRFDDEVTRYGFYRNFFDPYAREWQNGNSRWDIIDMVRLTRGLRPEGIEWPNYTEGGASFKLEDLCAANGIAHESAHDALSDVYATIALARLVRERQPKLYDYVFQHRGKRAVAPLVNLRERRTLLHVSSMYPNQYGSMALVVPLMQHPVNNNGIIVYDLRYDPASLAALDVEEIRHRLFTPRAELAEGEERVPLKTLHINKCPVVVPLGTLTPDAAKRWQIDLQQAEVYRDRLLRDSQLCKKLEAAYAGRESPRHQDPDESLYSGGFFSSADRLKVALVRDARPDELAGLHLDFEDDRLPELLFRYRARNYPDTLSASERERWEEFRQRRLTAPDGGGSITLDAYFQRIAELRTDPVAQGKGELLDELEAYGRAISPRSTSATPL